VAEEVSDISLACRQIGPIHFKKKFSQGEDMFRHAVLYFSKDADRPRIHLGRVGVPPGGRG
jgi:catabolite regulation protein CreA